MWWASTSFATSERRVHSVVAVFLAARDATVEPQDPPPTTTTRMFMGATLLVPEFTRATDRGAVRAPGALPEPRAGAGWPDAGRRPGAVQARRADRRRLPAMPGPLAPPAVAALVPVKAFHLAKARLAGILGAEERAALARRMATLVLRRPGPLPVAVVCDDEAVAAWATEHDATVLWRPGRGLNPAVQEAVAALGRRGLRPGGRGPRRSAARHDAQLGGRLSAG